jgi:hypothetical protein
VPAEVVGDLRSAAAVERARLVTVTGSDAKAALADLVARADVIHFHDADLRREPAACLSPNGSERGDGIPGYALGFGDLGSRLAPLVVRTLGLGRSQAAKSYELACSAPLLALVATDGDEPGDWLRAGRALQRVLLEASRALVATSFLNQPLEIPELRAQVRRIAELDGAPQLLLRLGYAPRTRATPRRPVSEIVIP